jgi:nucleotide-binding universal stress UspA family protein
VPTTALLCTDGSHLAIEALHRGVALLAPDAHLILATVAHGPDETLVTGVSGFAGGSMSPEEFEQLRREQLAEAKQIVTETLAALEVDAETRVVDGNPGPALCALAADIGADVIVMGSRGRSGLARALLGSVSDHVVRNAPCTVMITGVED